MRSVPMRAKENRHRDFPHRPLDPPPRKGDQTHFGDMFLKGIIINLTVPPLSYTQNKVKRSVKELLQSPVLTHRQLLHSLTVQFCHAMTSVLLFASQ